MKTRLNLINSSNPGKVAEFIKLFSKHGYILDETKFKKVDFPEIVSDPETVAAVKAKMAAEKHGVSAVLIDDTSLDIEGHPDAGVEIRKWLDEEPEKFQPCVGLSAIFRCILAFTEDNQIAYLASGKVTGIICNAKYSDKGEGFGFDPVFQPDGSTQSLAQHKPDEYNARAMAVENLLKNNIKSVSIPAIWKGAWQEIHKNNDEPVEQKKLGV